MKNEFSGEEKEVTKKRILADAELVKGGAEIGDKGNLVLSDDQLEKEKRDSDGVYGREEKINGVNIKVYWYENDKTYTLFLEDNPGQEQVIYLGKDENVAKDVFKMAKDEANENGDGSKVYEVVDDYIKTLNRSK